ncbi:hypothetical protein LFZ31_00020 [Salmonella enterica subsp. enterica serovar Newport str. S09097]|nr:hypothetical protein LFZ31_00020 [Salmonella enterica subsp. enterica serovar Newport str. S09097]
MIFKVSLKISRDREESDLFDRTQKKICKNINCIYIQYCVKMMTSVKAYFTYKINTYYKLKAIYTFF